MVAKMLLIATAVMGLGGVAHAKERPDSYESPRAVKETAPGRSFKESSKLGRPAEKYDYIYRVSDKLRTPESRDVI
jgi:hypothetical protein